MSLPSCRSSRSPCAGLATAPRLRGHPCSGHACTSATSAVILKSRFARCFGSYRPRLNPLRVPRGRHWLKESNRQSRGWCTMLGKAPSRASPTLAPRGIPITSAPEVKATRRSAPTVPVQIQQEPGEPQADQHHLNPHASHSLMISTARSCLRPSANLGQR